MGNYVDLTGPLTAGMWHYGGPFPPFGTEVIATPATHGYRAATLHLSTHLGTHTDAPRHYWDDGAGVDEVPLELFAGPGRVLPLWECGRPLCAIGVEALRAAGADDLGAGEVALIATGWDERWMSQDYSSLSPHLTVEAARFLVSKRIRLLGTDTALCCDPREGETQIQPGAVIPDHVLLQAGVPYINGLVNLRALPHRGFTFYGFPLRIVGGDGSPLRAVAYVGP